MSRAGEGAGSRAGGGQQHGCSPHTYDEAIQLAGAGRYGAGLLATLSLALIALGLDMFGFSVVVSGSSCDLQLDLVQKTTLLSMPFLGPIIMAYIWGYMSDTRGRKRSLQVALWASFMLSTASAFSPNWIVLAILRLLSTSFCVQSASYALLGESCPPSVNGAYMLIMTSVLNFGFATYMVIAFGILNLEFTYNLGFISFVPWRLLAIALASPLGLSAILLCFFYESPKFLLNAGHEHNALEQLRKIWLRNGGVKGDYPVKKVMLSEKGNERCEHVSLLKSLWQQTAPLFRPPLLVRTLQLYYLTAVVYSVSNAMLIWFPVLAESFAATLAPGSASHSAPRTHGLCDIIHTSHSFRNSNETVAACTSGVAAPVALSALIEGVVFMSVNLAISTLSSRKRTLTVLILTASGAAGGAAVALNQTLAASVLFFGLLFSGLCIGILFSYFVELYPTSYRGMAGCGGVMMSRAAGLLGVNLVGSFVSSHCSVTLYCCSGALFSGALVALFLPPDNTK